MQTWKPSSKTLEFCLMANLPEVAKSIRMHLDMIIMMGFIKYKLMVKLLMKKMYKGRKMQVIAKMDGQF